MHTEIPDSKDYESPESNLITAILATYFEDLRAFRAKKQFAGEDCQRVIQNNIDSLVDCAAGEWTGYLCGLISVDHDWFMEQIIACAAGVERTPDGKQKSLNRYAAMPRTRRRVTH